MEGKRYAANEFSTSDSECMDEILLGVAIDYDKEERASSASKVKKSLSAKIEFQQQDGLFTKSASKELKFINPSSQKQRMATHITSKISISSNRSAFFSFWSFLKLMLIL
ncbi:hypothetical protein WAI453_012491 [Rhynchosporium graminicola]